MNATIVDLKHKMKEVLIALENRESVNLLYHGKVKGTIIPVNGYKKGKITEHEFFGMFENDEHSVDEVMNHIRGGRYDDI